MTSKRGEDLGQLDLSEERTLQKRIEGVDSAELPFLRDAAGKSLRKPHRGR